MLHTVKNWDVSTRGIPNYDQYDYLIYHKIFTVALPFFLIKLKFCSIYLSEGAHSL